MTTRNRTAKPCLEALEDRQLMAINVTGPAQHVTASLFNGVLSIHGTSKNDTIVVRQALPAGPISVNGVDIRIANATVTSVAATDVNSIEVWGGKGNDAIDLYTMSSPPPIVINAGPGNDTITGTNASDEIHGDGGDDKISGQGGNDYLHGEAGKNLIHGDAGEDHLYGGLDRDELFGDADDDYLWGGESGDLLNGGTDDDNLFGQGGDDNVSGGTGEDFLSGGAGTDTLFGRDLAYEQGHDKPAEYDRFQDEFNPNQWVVGSVSHLDVDQVRPPTCNFLSALAAVASGNNNLGGRIRYLGNNQYGVTLFGGWSAVEQQVEFDGTWTSNDAAPTRLRDATGRPTGAIVGEYWTLLYQRAYLDYRGINHDGVNWRDVHDPALWEDANGNDDWANNRIAMEAASGMNTASHDISPSVTARTFRDFFAQGDVMNALYNGHRWTIRNIFWHAPSSGWRITLYNPRAIDHADLGEDSLNDGVQTIGWGTFESMFTHVRRGIRNSPL